MKRQLVNRLKALGFTIDNGRVSCDQCEVVVIQGYPTHETGCPNARHECAGCNELIPMRQRFCAECAP